MELQTPNTTTNNGRPSNPDPNSAPPNPTNAKTHNTQEHQPFFEDIDSTCSTPYVSAPSSPGRGSVGGFFYSAPASPMHFALSSAFGTSPQGSSTSAMDEFEFSARFGSSGFGGSGSMSSADELFLNGKIRPMKLSTHLEKPQVLAPLIDLEAEYDTEVEFRGRDLRLRDKSLRRRTRSMSPLRNTVLWAENEDSDGTKIVNENGCLEENEREKIEGLSSSETTTPSVSASSSRSSSAGRSSKRWVFLKDFLRSKSEGRSNNKFWSTISFTPMKEKKLGNQTASTSSVSKDHKLTNPLNGAFEPQKSKGNAAKKVSGKPANGVGKRRVPPSPHELHYTANRAQAEELRKKTFLPYKQGLLGCLGFSSKGYGAMNGFARALNPVSSR